MYGYRIENGEKKFFIKTDRLSNEYQKQIKTLEMLYRIDNIVYPYDNKKELKKKNDRICKFCGKTNHDITFKNKAHLLPEFLGNTNYLSDFECDKCNSIVSRYENDLANYFGAFLTFSGISGKNKVPKFKSNSQSVEIEFNAPFIDVDFKNAEVFKESIGYAENGNILNVEYNSRPFTPLNVFRALVKIGLSTMNDFQYEKLSDATDFLLKKGEYNGLENNLFFNIHKFFIPGPFQMPPIVISLKKDSKFIDYPAPTHLSILQVNNIILQWFTPYHKDDMFFFLNRKIKPNFFIVPPLLPVEWLNQFGNPFSEQLKLGSDKRIKSLRMGIAYKNPHQSE